MAVVQSPHVEEPAHGSVPLHSLAIQFHDEQLPAAGPVEEPPLQLALSSHQPQPGLPVQDAHELSAHGSGAALHDEGVMTQSAHVPLVGPLMPPRSHAPVDAHQPHSARAAQSPQVVAAHGSAAPHNRLNHVHAEQDPLLGPSSQPPWQLLLSPHQPHPACDVQSPHALLAAAHGSVTGVWHDPSVHARPAQQSPSVAHVCEPVRQVQRPASHNMLPQQSSELVHVPAASEQHTVLVGLARHDSGRQQLASVEHVTCAAPHVPAVRHTLAVQSKPRRQRSPEVQQAWLFPPQSAWHWPLMQVVPQGDAVQLPQLRGSVLVSTHAPSQHAPRVQVVPLQHA